MQPPDRQGFLGIPIIEGQNRGRKKAHPRVWSAAGQENGGAVEPTKSDANRIFEAVPERQVLNSILQILKLVATFI